MLYLQVVSSTSGFISLGYHLSAADGIDRRARRCGIVDAVVCPVAFQHRVETAVREARRDAIEVERGLQESTFEAVAPFVVVEFLAVLHEGDSVVQAVFVCERGGQDVEVFQTVAVDVFLFVDDAELVLLLQSEEVDGPAEDIGQLHGQLGRGVALLHGHPERRFHLAFHLLPFPFRGILAAAHTVFAAQVEDDVRFRTLFVDEEACAWQAVLGGEHGVGLSALHLAGIECAFGPFVQAVYVVHRQAVALQDGRQVLAVLDDAVIHVVAVGGDAIFISDGLHFGRVGHFHFVQHVGRAVFPDEVRNAPCSCQHKEDATYYIVYSFLASHTCLVVLEGAKVQK